MVFLALAATALAACSTTSPAGPSGSGIDGMVRVDGGCPMVKDATGCPDKPLAAKITVTPTGVTTVEATVTSGADGHFTIALPPGTYTLHPANVTGSLLPTAQPQDVTVTAGAYTTVTVEFDSGIRAAPMPVPVPASSGEHVNVTWTPQQPSPAQISVKAGTRVIVELHPDGVYRWRQPVSSNPEVAVVGTAGFSQEGVTGATVTTLKSGSVEITAEGLFPGDPHGPMSRRWALTIEVSA